ncbi:SLC45 family MFS transporter [Caenibacillus caldisaponilyticus]|uniref:SLC45 family MFS transporter n=1 Tax=Caenibacillus caldisaponilyticus TaxID=1674942 RepID=UPI000988939B|nr:SLC45 family MFS transporter [Caenibacillus caldisaponilyticus]
MKKVWLLGFGFFSISLTWALYNAFVPLFLDDYLKSTAAIGFLMTVDNYFALFIQPWIGNLSDRTDTPFGKRMPYLLIGMPLSAVFFSLIPFRTSLATLILFMVLMNLSMSLYRSPTVALMPDITHEARRSQANGIINFMGGIGSVLAFGVGSFLYKIGPPVPFITASLATILSLVIVASVIKEKRDAIAYPPAGASAPVRFRGELDRTTVCLLGAIFFWFVAYQGIEALFTLYGTHYLGMSDSAASFSLLFFSGSFLLFTLPSGWLGARFGKKPVITAGVIGLGACFAIMIFIDATVWLRLFLVLGGLFWACININSYPFVVSIGRAESIGTRTGLYYLVSAVAAILSPPLLGQFVDWFGYSVLFIYTSLGMLAALVFILLVPNRGLAAGTPPTLSEEKRGA